ncbi:MAG TPA: ABC transporter ATP-binding protein [Desulfopila sp.]|nr:ABC transporter ATP-binding protein [Desulfopila sp.]
MNILETQDITKLYTIGERQIAVVDRVSLQVKEGEFVVITGSSGSGKTTLLTLLSGLDRPTSGKIFVAGEDITSSNEDQLAEMRNMTTGFVFQDFHLVPSLNALENVMFPAELAGDERAEEKARSLLERVGLWQRSNNFPEQLSGGEKQRVALCRALINTPRILFADEPTGNLDSRNSREIVSLLLEMQRESNTTLVMATHSPEIAALAERILNLHDGRLVKEREDHPAEERSGVEAKEIRLQH